MSSIDLALQEMPIERTLGLSLDYNSDSFVVSANVKTDCSTKREILRETSSVYDPFGFLSPALLSAKLILQVVCRKSVSWDEQLDQDLVDEWKKWATAFSISILLSIPRCFNASAITSTAVELHVFADASESAFGAIAYLRSIQPDGIKIAEFSTEHRFYTGPPFLYESPENWPTFSDLKKEVDETEDVEIRCTKWVGTTIRVPDSIDKLRMKNSRYPFLLGVVGYVKRFINNARKGKQHRQFGKLSEFEIKSAEWELFRRTQLSAFPMELKDLKTGRTIESSSSLITLTPLLDLHGVLRVGGRIENAPVSPEVYHPIILPAHEKLTQLLIYSTHLEFQHSTPERTLNELRKFYWVQGERKTIRRVLNTCFTCKRNNAKALCPMMAALPGYRLKPFYPAFTYTGVDFFGPFNMSQFSVER